MISVLRIVVLGVLTLGCSCSARHEAKEATDPGPAQLVTGAPPGHDRFIEPSFSPVLAALQSLEELPRTARFERTRTIMDWICSRAVEHVDDKDTVFAPCSRNAVQSNVFMETADQPPSSFRVVEDRRAGPARVLLLSRDGENVYRHEEAWFVVDGDSWKLDRMLYGYSASPEHGLDAEMQQVCAGRELRAPGPFAAMDPHSIFFFLARAPDAMRRAVVEAAVHFAGGPPCALLDVPWPLAVSRPVPTDDELAALLLPHDDLATLADFHDRFCAVGPGIEPFLSCPPPGANTSRPKIVGSGVMRAVVVGEERRELEDRPGVGFGLARRVCKQDPAWVRRCQHPSFSALSKAAPHDPVVRSLNGDILDGGMFDVDELRARCLALWARKAGVTDCAAAGTLGWTQKDLRSAGPKAFPTSIGMP